MHCPFGFNGTWRKILISSSLSNKKTKQKKNNTKYHKQSIILWYVFKCSKLYTAATCALWAFSSAHTREHVVGTWRGDMYQRQVSSCDLPFFCKIKISCRYQIVVPATFRFFCPLSLRNASYACTRRGLSLHSPQLVLKCVLTSGFL